jgi:type IV pilus biogenesis protein PilP
MTALVLTFALAVTALVRAVRLTPVEASETSASAALVRATSTPLVPEIDVEAVGANDIFQPDRNALPYRYRMPGEPAPGDGAPAPDLPKPTVLGTVLSTDGSHFATCQLPGGRPTVVHVGDKLGDYTVVAIERSKVVFKTASGARLEVAAIRPGTNR